MKRDIPRVTRKRYPANSPGKGPTPPDYAAINAVIEKHLDLAWTEKNQRTIRHSIGGGEFQKIEEIIAFASNQDAWLQDNSLSAAADKVAGRLSQHYPLLSQMAVFRIISQATYGWR